jgi:hypothetical protein
MREEIYAYLHTKSWRGARKMLNLYDIVLIVMQMRYININIFIFISYTSS